MKSLQTITSFPEGITLLVPAIFPSLVATLLIVTSPDSKQHGAPLKTQAIVHHLF